MYQLKIVNVNPNNWASLAISARDFMRDYPDRLGLRQGVVYGTVNETFYIYRTKTQIIVRGI